MDPWRPQTSFSVKEPCPKLQRTSFSMSPPSPLLKPPYVLLRYLGRAVTPSYLYRSTGEEFFTETDQRTGPRWQGISHSQGNVLIASGPVLPTDHGRSFRLATLCLSSMYICMHPSLGMVSLRTESIEKKEETEQSLPSVTRGPHDVDLGRFVRAVVTGGTQTPARSADHAWTKTIIIRRYFHVWIWKWA